MSVTATFQPPQAKRNASARPSGEVLRKRIATIKDVETYSAPARGQMNLIENSVRLLRDQALTVTSPEALTDQLDDLLTGVDAVQQSVKDAESLIHNQLPPIVAVESEAEQQARPSRVRS